MGGIILTIRAPLALPYWGYNFKDMGTAIILYCIELYIIYCYKFGWISSVLSADLYGYVNLFMKLTSEFLAELNHFSQFPTNLYFSECPLHCLQK